MARRVLEATSTRHKSADRAGWALAPELKDGVGGLRDLHALFWLARIAETSLSNETLDQAGDLLLAVREALHAEVKRKSDRLRIDLQPAVARRMGLDSDDGPNILMSEVHSAARAIEHGSALRMSELAGQVLGGPKRSGVARQLAPAVRLEDGRLHADGGVHIDPVEDAMQLLAIASETGRPIAPKSLVWLEETFARPPMDTWTATTRDSFLQVLAGPHATQTLEIMDHVGAWNVLLPEWGGVRGLAQHDPYHRYTVDGHSFVAVAKVKRAIENDAFGRAAAAEAGDLKTLYVGTLLHDVGKGSGEDHSVAGERFAHAAATRMGFDEAQIDEVAALVRHHLLLVDTATRRDLDDGAVIEFVVETVRHPRRLRLLYLLSVADGNATGREGWSDWKGTLVRELYLRVLTAMETGELPTRSDVAMRAREVEAYEPTLAGRVEAALDTLPPSYLSATSTPDIADDIRLLLTPPQPGQVKHRVDEGTEAGQLSITVAVVDRPGTLARTAGVLALNRVSVLTANAFATTHGIALQRFVVRPHQDVDWHRFGEDLEAAYSGRLAIEARLGKKVIDYRPAKPFVPEVRVLQEESAHSTVIEVRAPDALGLLWAITASLTELDLDIHVAKIDTLGERVVDVFYVRSSWGEKLNDEQALEVTRSIEHRVSQLFGD
ncbi:MAG: [protein-PII] uridylyltransferase [Actinomycetota bacterium]|nr:[protein-PII] uridylyltransferase [Actinomycetota bacterium]